jgi:hypothetical protein
VSEAGTFEELRRLDGDFAALHIIGS